MADTGRRVRCAVALLGLVVGLVLPASGQAPAARRLALVIGNAAYAEPAARLSYPVNDARAMTAMLEELGFTVTVETDADILAMERAADRFIGQVRSGDVALFYYSGHGIEVGGENYLAPVDFLSDYDVTQARRRSLAALEVQERMAEAGARVRLVILDACRDNPFERTKTLTRGGLTAMQGRGGLVAFAAEAGARALEPPGERNGLYTKHLLEALEEPDVPIRELLTRVRTAVHEASNERQTPATYDALVGDFVFRRGIVPGRRLAFGTPASATLSGSGSDRWTFTGRADEQVTVELTSEAFDTYLELRGPTGELVMDNDDGGDDLNSLIENQTLDESGDYTVVARAYDDDGGGQYSLLLRRGVSGRRRLVVGTPASATLLGSWSDRWTFTGRAGDQVTVELTSEAFDTYLELLGPAGELVMENDDGGDDRNSLIENQTLDESGDYTVVARAYDDDGGGQYSLLLRRGVSGRRRLVVGTPASATLLGSGSDRWTFTGRAGDQVTVELTSEAFDTYLELLGPAGELVMENDDGGDDRNSLIENQTLDESGDYTVVARAYDGSGDGLYTLSVLTAATDSLRQAITISERYPLEFRRESRDAGYVITNLAHANGRWLMTMTDVSSSDILQFNPTDDSFDEIQERIDEGLRDGYAISDLAVGQGTWAVSMTTGTGLTNQDYIRRSLFPSDWIEDRWDEGRHVTSVAFGDGEWIVVTSGSTGWTNQRFATRSSYNDFLTWIEDRWDAGARITDIAHGNGRWAAVASDNTGIGRQSFVRLPSAAFLSSSVEEQRSDGNMVEDVAFDGDYYWILLSAGDAIRWPGSQ